MKYRIFTLAVVVTVFFSCKKKKQDEDQQPDFDRSELLKNLADNVIIPRFTNFNNSIVDLENKYNTFSSSNTLSNFQDLRQSFKSCYFAWQGCSPFDFGPSENYVLKGIVNTYPVDTTKINTNINNGGYVLGAANNVDAIGLPAIDFLLFEDTNTNLALARFTTNSNASKRMTYLIDNINFIKSSSNNTLNDWNNNYRSTFINADGTDVGSSLGLLVNSLNKDFEKFIRDGKVGIPVGVRSLGTPLPEKTEAYYAGFSVDLLTESITKLKSFINGNGETAGTNGFDDYLNHLEAMHGSNLLSNKINDQFTQIETKISELNTFSLSEQVVNNQTKVNELYDELQKMVVLLKVDLSSALSILITYQDNDGD